MPRKVPDHRQYFCTRCAKSTRWELQIERGVYLCVGDNQFHPERKAYGCGREVLIESFYCKIRQNENLEGFPE